MFLHFYSEKNYNKKAWNAITRTDLRYYNYKNTGREKFKFLFQIMNIS